jgi:hypothetical protein
MESQKDQLIQQIQQKAKKGSLDDLVDEIQSHLGLTFELNTSPTPNLCLKDAIEVRDEYKTTFSLQDLAHYLSAIGIKNIHLKIEEISLPKDAATFWGLVRKGKKK